MRKLNVFVSATLFGTGELLKERGWNIVEDIKKANLVLFTGGADISPDLYNEPTHPFTFFHPRRDKIEVEDYSVALAMGLPMAGICRGGQLLNAMAGGKMHQHVTGHARGGTHKVKDLWSGEEWDTTSAHHQMIIPTDDALIIAVTDPSICKVKERMSSTGEIIKDDPKATPDYEVVYYPKIKGLCYQGHPEYSGSKEGTEKFFQYVADYLFDGQL